MTQPIHNERDDTQSRTIQNDIDRTRTEMDRTLDQLGERLNPGNLVGSAVGMFTGKSGRTSASGSPVPAGVDGRRETASYEDDDSGIADTITSAVKALAGSAVGVGLLSKVRQHPLLSAAVGAGVAYIALQDKSSKQRRRIERNHREPQMYGGSYVDARTGEPYDIESYERQGREYRGAEGRQGAGIVSQAADYASAAAGAVGSAASSAAGAIGSAASSAASAIGGAASSTRDAVGHAAGTAADSARTYGSVAGDHAVAARGYAGERASSLYASSRDSLSSGVDRSRRAGEQGYAYSRDRFTDALGSNPLAVAAGALAAGLLAGLAAPRTQKEDQLMGGYSRNLKNTAGDAAAEAYERGRTVVDASLTAAQEEAARRGVTPESLRQKVGELAADAKDRAGELMNEAKREGSDILGRAKSEGQDVLGQAKQAAGQLAETAKSAAGDAVGQVKGEGGDVAGNVQSRSESLANDAQQKVQNVKADALADAEDLKLKAEDKGLTPTKLADDAKSVLEAAKDAAVGEAKHQADDAKTKHNL